MTEAQWLFEYYAARKKEEADVNHAVELHKAKRSMLVDLLGLNLIKRPDGEVVVPLSVMCGQPEVMSHIFDEQRMEEGVTTALNDPEFDEWSERMARGEIDDDLWPAEEPEETPPEFRSPKVSFDGP